MDSSAIRQFKKTKSAPNKKQGRSLFSRRTDRTAVFSVIRRTTVGGASNAVGGLAKLISSGAGVVKGATTRATVEDLWFNQSDEDHEQKLGRLISEAYGHIGLLDIFRHLVQLHLSPSAIIGVFSWCALSFGIALLVCEDVTIGDALSGVFHGAIGQLSGFFLLFYFQEGYGRWNEFFNLLVISEGRIAAITGLAAASLQDIDSEDRSSLNTGKQGVSDENKSLELVGIYVRYHEVSNPTTIF